MALRAAQNSKRQTTAYEVGVISKWLTDIEQKTCQTPIFSNLPPLILHLENPMNPPQWQILADASAVAHAAAQHILAVAQTAIQERGAFRLVLAGGSTPERTYRLLATYQDAPVDWANWHIYYGDERCLPPHHGERNSQMAAHAWLAQSAIPPAQQHPIPAELGATAGAAQYASVVAAALPFDLVLLGMGEDGHTASLFPGQKLETEWLTQAVFNAPKPPPERVSLSLAALRSARERMFLITGAGKREALQAWHSGVALPAAQVAALAPMLILLDQAAQPD